MGFRREKGGGPFIAFPLLNSSLSAPQYSPLFLHQGACIDCSARKTCYMFAVSGYEDKYRAETITNEDKMGCFVNQTTCATFFSFKLRT